MFKIKRLDRIYSILRQYLCWVQNSVFEGEISKSQLIELGRFTRNFSEQKTLKTENSLYLY
ncbi:MAG TPA: CRISPR-associated endonuclease Cas2 [Nanoarchaeota archaeon]|nr:CRISPR-associated endonuclease Cas2 [Nanoarchaeota archaeon]